MRLGWFCFITWLFLSMISVGVLYQNLVYGQEHTDSDYSVDNSSDSSTSSGSSVNSNNEVKPKTNVKKSSKSKSRLKSKTRLQDNQVQHRRTSGFLSHAVGGGINWMMKKEYGELYQKKVIPELSFMSYFNIYSPFFLKHSIRVGYSWMKPQMPQSLQVREDELILLTDVGALYNWFVVPSLYIGCGSFYRTTKLYTKDPIHVEHDYISDSEWIFVWYAQFGVATPVLRDVVVLEPYVRFLFVNNDARIKFSFGAELSYYLVRRW